MDLVEEPALEFPVSGVVVPDAEESQWSETSLSAEDEVHDAPGYQLLFTKPRSVTGN